MSTSVLLECVSTHVSVKVNVSVNVILSVNVSVSGALLCCPYIASLTTGFVLQQVNNGVCIASSIECCMHGPWLGP